MGFGDKFNRWLVEQGETTLTEEEIVLFNEAGNRTAQKMRSDSKVIVEKAQQLASALSKRQKGKGG